MENRGLIFIPDISGFTSFVNKVEIDHGRMIIEELLEVLINANKIGLEISEIEGDAILFYKFGDKPTNAQLFEQVQEMFCSFHRAIKAYEVRKYCQCKACISVSDLTLKVITHYGEFTGYNVRQFNKLIGKDIIVAHQLLKNDIEQHEYWLVTKNIASEPLEELARWMNWRSSQKNTESGEIGYHYTQLTPLKEELKPELHYPVDFSRYRKLFSRSREYDKDIISLFHLTGDYSSRNKWRDGVVSVEIMNHWLPRIGMKCKLRTSNGEIETISEGYSFSPTHIQFTESEDGGKRLISYSLSSINEHKTRLEIDFYTRKGFASLFTNTGKWKSSMERSMSNIGKALN